MRPPSRAILVDSSNAGDRSGRLHDDVETALGEPPRLDLGVDLRDLDDRVRAECERKLELLVSHPVRDDRRGRAKAGEADGDRAERADSDHADRLPGLDVRPFERLQHDRARLDEHRRVERHVLGKRMHDTCRDDDELAVPAAAGEADRVVASRTGACPRRDSARS